MAAGFYFPPRSADPQLARLGDVGGCRQTISISRRTLSRARRARYCGAARTIAADQQQQEAAWLAESFLGLPTSTMVPTESTGMQTAKKGLPPVMHDLIMFRALFSDTIPLRFY